LKNEDIRTPIIKGKQNKKFTFEFNENIFSEDNEELQ
jgi:hypothetical protein